MHLNALVSSAHLSAKGTALASVTESKARASRALNMRFWEGRKGMEHI